MRRIAGVAVSLGLAAGALLVGAQAAAARHGRASSWRSADADGDGRPLWRDADADGDGVPFWLDDDADGDGRPNTPDLLAAAEAGLGRPADPLMGRWGDPLGRLGFVVCVDVALEAWLSAGLSLPALLLESAVAHPEWFPIDPTNEPGDPYFLRRVRNWRALFAHDPRLELSDTPRPGDWAFSGSSHVILVDRATPSGWTGIEAYDATVRRRDSAHFAWQERAPDVFGRIATTGSSAASARPQAGTGTVDDGALRSTDAPLLRR